MSNETQNMNGGELCLAVETSSRIGSIAVGVGDEIVDEREFSAGFHHGVEMLPVIEALLADHNLQRSDLKQVFISAGPGSFTGLRVAFTFARVIGQILRARVVPVPSCRVIAENLVPQLKTQQDRVSVAAVLDAKRQQIYTAGFSWDGRHLEKALDEQAMYPTDLLARLPRPLWLVGEGIEYHRPSLQAEGVVITDKEYWRPRASIVLKLGRRLAGAGVTTDYSGLVPTYIRLPEAEERWQSGLLGGTKQPDENSA
jgi:tRNA threonylcarbamoyl adenosine modification protein YeaZ